MASRVVASQTIAALRRAHDLADRDYAQPLTVDAMARAAHLSKFHFARLFASTYGETPRAYLSRRRIERARDLLRVANLTVTEVCYLVGYESLGTFSARFRDVVGCSPSEYRRRVVEESGPPQVPGCFIFMWSK